MAKVKSVCKQCGKEFEHRYDRKRIFCSKECTLASQRIHISCKQCSNMFIRSKSKTSFFCSSNCFKMFKKSLKILTLCKICKKELYNLKDKNVVFCSKKCVGKNLNPEFWSIATKEQKIERWLQVFEKYVIRQEGCWDWTGTKDKGGYPKLQQNMRGHRFSYMYYNGEIPKGMLVCHTCDFP